MSRPIVTVILACVLACAWAVPVWAFRPFDLTDASVAARREMELEFGPFGYITDAEGRFLVAPSFILNFGLSRDWEIVIEGRNFVQLEDEAGRRHTLRDNAFSVKHVLRRGSLQEGQGPSVGVEVGLLLPGVGVDSGVGASFGGLVSQRWSSLTLHVNSVLEITHDHRLAGITGGIVEGPSRWNVRPVAEVVFEQEQRGAVSGLVGAIWDVRDNLSVDVGWRIAGSGGDDAREFRAGFTWTVPLGSAPSAHPLMRSATPLEGRR